MKTIKDVLEGKGSFERSDANAFLRLAKNLGKAGHYDLCCFALHEYMRASVIYGTSKLENKPRVLKKLGTEGLKVIIDMQKIFMVGMSNVREFIWGRDQPDVLVDTIRNWTNASTADDIRKFWRQETEYMPELFK